MALNHFSEIFLPYCLQRKKTGWVVLNREYHGLGVDNAHKDYSEQRSPVVNIKIPNKLLTKLKSYPGRGGIYWFYDDLTNPAHNKKNAKMYADLLLEFFSCEVK